MGAIRTRVCGHATRALSATLVLTLLAALLLAALLAAGPAGAAGAKPGKPTAKTPKGTVTSVTPTFAWSKAARATSYEVQVYQGGRLVLKKTGLKARTWKANKALPTAAALTWKVRARNARGNGAWSARLAFSVAPPSPDKAITAFGFASPAATGAITEAAHTIAVTVPHGTNVSALVATFTTTGASVAVGATPQVSGVTANDFSSPVTYTVTAADASTQTYVVTVTVAASPAKAITAFSFQGLDPAVTGTVTEATHTIALTVPHGTDVSALVATWAVSPGASVRVGPMPQISGLTSNDFSSPVTYTVTAADATSQTYLVTVTIALDPAKAITAFSFVSPAATGVITEAAHTIAVAVPAGTDVSALVATFTTTGASVAVGATPQVSGLTANDFSSPVTYTVTAADSTTQSYVVTVSVAGSSAKAITAFSFQGLDPAVTGAVNETAHTVDVIVPAGTADTALVATFTTTGASVAVGGAHQTSGTTVNDFTSSVTYTVTAADASTQDYLVTVYRIGKSYGGGSIAYILQSGDPGYVAGETRGLIAASADTYGVGIPWDLSSHRTTYADATELGTGLANTNRIIASQGEPAAAYAAGAARAYDGGGYHDWYLPSRDELDKLYANHAAIGGFDPTSFYWSSSEGGEPVAAWEQYFGNGVQDPDVKDDRNKVRAVRAFPANWAKALTSFSFLHLSGAGTITEEDHTIAVTVPYGSDVSSLAATFIATGTSVKVGDTPQVSGETTNDFSSPVTFTVTADDGTTRDYTVTVTVEAAPKAMTSFGFQGLDPPVSGAVSEADHTIAVTVPHGTDVSALVATFSASGTSVTVDGAPQVSGTTANDFTDPVSYTVTAADSSTRVYVVTVTVLSASLKAITAFSFQGLNPSVTGVITEAAHTIALTVPYGTDVSALAATFVTTGAFVEVAGVAQTDGETINDFSSPVTYTVTAADASTQTYVVTVTVAANTAKAITAFSFQGLDPVATGTVTEATHTIAVAVPYGTDVSALVATFTTTGASVKVGGVAQASGVTANDFSSPVTYTVTAADTSTQVYVVTVTVLSSSAKAITELSLEVSGSAYPGGINETAHTIAVIVPAGTDDTALVATFTTTGVSVKVGGASQTSGATANDFTDPVTYTVTAADSSTQTWVVTVYSIGKSFQGGKIAYIFNNLEPGYIDGETHGLIAAAADQQSTGIQWYNGSAVATGATATELGSGAANTTAIIGAQGEPATGYAAGVARAYAGGGYSDWYLPSKDELGILYGNRAAIGGFNAVGYWSSSEFDAGRAHYWHFGTGLTGNTLKSSVQGRVRAIRNF